MTQTGDREDELSWLRHPSRETAVQAAKVKAGTVKVLLGLLVGGIRQEQHNASDSHSMAAALHVRC